MRFSVIMPAYLGEYPTRGKNPEYKFKRAIDTFLLQEFKDAELIVVADGCRVAESIYTQNFTNEPSVRFRYIDKQTLFSGRVRQTGIEMAQGDIICYLDSDDIFGVKHLAIINQHFDTRKYDWIYYNDYLIINEVFNLLERNISPIPCQIGTSCIAHKRSLNAVWGDHYGHDWAFIKDNLFMKRAGVKIPTPQYYVCHCPGGYDF